MPTAMIRNEKSGRMCRRAGSRPAGRGSRAGWRSGAGGGRARAVPAGKVPWRRDEHEGEGAKAAERLGAAKQRPSRADPRYPCRSSRERGTSHRRRCLDRRVQGKLASGAWIGVQSGSAISRGEPGNGMKPLAQFGSSSWGENHRARRPAAASSRMDGVEPAGQEPPLKGRGAP